MNLEDLINKLDGYVNEHPDVWGHNFDPLLTEFVMRGYCPKDISFAMSVMADRDWRFKDGRRAVHCPPYQIPLTEEFCLRVYGHKVLHTGELQCLH